MQIPTIRCSDCKERRNRPFFTPTLPKPQSDTRKTAQVHLTHKQPVMATVPLSASFAVEMPSVTIFFRIPGKRPSLVKRITEIGRIGEKRHPGLSSAMFNLSLAHPSAPRQPRRRFPDSPFTQPHSSSRASPALAQSERSPDNLP